MVNKKSTINNSSLRAPNAFGAWQSHMLKDCFAVLAMTLVLVSTFFISTPAAQADPASASPPPEEETAEKGLRGAVDIFNIAKEKAGFVGVATSPEIVAGQIIQGLILVIGVIFGILIIYGGFLWMTARGNEETVKKAISILQNSVIGFILVIAAYAITNFVVGRVLGAAFQ